MSKSRLIPVVDQSNIKIYLSEHNHFSIGTSPYYAHQNAIAMDIYHRITIENHNVVSPISGKVLQIKELKAPKARFKNGIDREYLTIIENPHDNKTVFKVLHIKPEVEPGQKLEPGDNFGKTIRNGYFAPWSSPHIHLEMKRPEDTLRAKEGLPFTINFKEQTPNELVEKRAYFNQIPVKIEFIYNEFFLCHFPEDLYQHIEPFYGVKGTNSHISFIVDGGIPQYKHGIIHLHNKGDSNKIDEIHLNTMRIGTLTGFQEKYGFVNFDNVKFLLNNTLIRGISLFLAKNRPLIKLIPFNKEEFELKLNSIQHLKLLSN